VSAAVQQQLAQVLQAHDYDLGAARSGALRELDQALQAVRSHLPVQEGEADDQGDAAGSEATPACSKLGKQQVGQLRALEAALVSQRDAVAALYDKLAEALVSNPLQAGDGAGGSGGGDATQKPRNDTREGSLVWRSGVLEHERRVREGVKAVAAALSSSGGGGDVAQRLEAAVGRLLETANDSLVLDLVVRLPLAHRTALLSALPPVSARLNAMGADLGLLKAHQLYTARSGAIKSSGRDDTASDGPVVRDVLGFVHMSDAQLEQLLQALSSVRKSATAVSHQLAALQPPDGKQGTSEEQQRAVGGIGWLRRLARTRRDFAATVQAVQQSRQRRGRSVPWEGLETLQALQVGVSAATDWLTAHII
jgi:hypothetical protein